MGNKIHVRNPTQTRKNNGRFLTSPPSMAKRSERPLTKKEIVSNSAEFDECYFPDNSTKPIDWPVSPGEPSHFSDLVDQVGAQ